MRDSGVPHPQLRAGFAGLIALGFWYVLRSHAACRLLVVVFLAAGLHFETKRMAGGFELWM